MTTTRRHFEGLDGLRAVAALLVLSIHVGQHFQSFRPFSRGYLGVDLFFVISGFVIGAVYEGAMLDGRLSKGAYAEKRLLRLYPLIALGLVAGLIAMTVSHRNDDHSAARLLAQLFMFPSLWYAGNLFLLNAPQWSLFFELAVNAFHAALLRWLTSVRVVAVTAFSGIGLTVGAIQAGTVNAGFEAETFLLGFPRVGFSFFAGLIVYRIWRAGRLPSLLLLGWSALPIYAVVLVAAGYASSLYVDLAVVLLLGPLTVASAAGASAWGAGLRLAKLAGRLSFPVYALQAPYLTLVGVVLPPVYYESKKQVALWCLAAAALVLIAWLADRFIDRPLQRRGGKLLHLRRSRVQVATAP